MSRRAVPERSAEGEAEPTAGAAVAGGSPPGPWQTLRRSTRLAWDALGLVCVASALWFIVLLLVLAAAVKVGGLLGPFGLIGVAAGGLVLVHGPLHAGVAALANRIVDHDEPSVGAIFAGMRAHYVQAVRLSAVQLAILGGLGANAAFYGAHRGLLWSALGALVLYVTLIWAMVCALQWPLLAASRTNRRVEDWGTGLLIRNSIGLAASAPGHTVALFVVLAVVGALFGVSGIGMALLWPGWSAVVAAVSARQHLARFGAADPLEDLEGPVPPDVWRVR